MLTREYIRLWEKRVQKQMDEVVQVLLSGQAVTVEKVHECRGRMNILRSVKDRLQKDMAQYEEPASDGEEPDEELDDDPPQPRRQTQQRTSRPRSWGDT